MPLKVHRLVQDAEDKGLLLAGEGVYDEVARFSNPGPAAFPAESDVVAPHGGAQLRRGLTTDALGILLQITQGLLDECVIAHSLWAAKGAMCIESYFLYVGPGGAT